MARKTETYTVTDEGRDKGKAFLLTEMPATKAESWAIRALFALGSANVDVPDDVKNMGMSGLAEVGLKKLFAMPYATAGPLLDELMDCVQMQPDPKRPQVKRGLVEGDVEEVRTLLTLKWQVLKLHLDFSIAGGLSSSIKAKVPAHEKQPNAPTSQVA